MNGKVLPLFSIGITGTTWTSFLIFSIMARMVVNIKVGSCNVACAQKLLESAPSFNGIRETGSATIEFTVNIKYTVLENRNYISSAYVITKFTVRSSARQEIIVCIRHNVFHDDCAPTFETFG